MARIPAVKAEIKVSVAIEKFNAALIKYISVLQTDVSKTVAQSAFKLEAMMKRRCPVDTGRLRASIHTTLFNQTPAFSYSDKKGNTFDGSFGHAPKTALTALVGTNVEYAIYIEAGHSGQAPAGFARISLEELHGGLLSAVKAELAKHKRLPS